MLFQLSVLFCGAVFILEKSQGRPPTSISEARLLIWKKILNSYQYLRDSANNLIHYPKALLFDHIRTLIGEVSEFSKFFLIIFNFHGKLWKGWVLHLQLGHHALC